MPRYKPGSREDHEADRKARRVLELRDEGMSQTAIAAAVGLSQSQVSIVIREAGE